MRRAVQRSAQATRASFPNHATSIAGKPGIAPAALPMAEARASSSFALHANERADELTGRSGTPLRCVCCAPARSSPVHPPRPKPGRRERISRSARSGSTAAPVASPSAHLMSRRPQRRRTSRSWWAPPRACCARGPVTSSAVAAGLVLLLAAFIARATHRAPPSGAPVPCEGDLWGDLQCGGPGCWLTASAADTQTSTPPIPHPFP